MPGLVQYMEITMRDAVFGDANPYVANKPVKVLFTYLLIYLFTYLLNYWFLSQSNAFILA